MTEAATSWLTETDEALKTATNAAQAEDLRSSLSEYHDELESLLVRLREVDVASRVGRGVWWSGHVAAPDLLSRLSNAVDRPEQRPAQAFVRSLDDFAREVSLALRTQWQAYAGGRMGNAAALQQLVDALAQVESLATQRDGLSDVLRKLVGRQNELPTNEVMTLLDEAEERLGDLEAALQPPSIKRFLLAAARGGAGIDLLTDEVATWLRLHNAQLGFKVIAGSPVESLHD